MIGHDGARSAGVENAADNLKLRCIPEDNGGAFAKLNQGVKDEEQNIDDGAGQE